MAAKAAKDDKKKPAADVDPDDFMSKTDLKAALAVAEGGTPVPCALGMTRDKRHGLVMLAKRGRGKALAGDMEDTAEELDVELDTGSIRYGRASIDPRTDANLVTFTVHKEAPGAMWAPIQKRMMKAGYGRINIVTNTALENEPDDDAAATGPAATGPAATGPAATGPTATGPAATGAAAETAARIKDLSGTLAGLLKQIAAVLAIKPGLKENLVPIAAAARTALHEGQADIAADLIETLDDALKTASAPEAAAAPDAGGPSAGGPPSAAGPNVKAIADKANMAWGAYLKIAAREVDKLRAEVTSVYRDHGFGAEVDKFFASQIDPAMKRLRDSELAAKLAAASSSADAAERRRLLAEGVTIVESLEGVVASDPVLKKLDDNPFTQLVIAKTATATLGTLKKTLQSATQT
jgi:hypothetical protein